MAAPGTGWHERIAPDEAQRHAQAARGMVAMQREKSRRFGKGRALHRKPILALQATLRVLDGVPAHVRHGLFARPGVHAVTLRLSNGGTDVQSDRRSDVRGFSLRVHGLSGPSALGGTTDHQDFTLINHRAFAFADSRPFVGLVLAAGRNPVAVIGWALRTYGPLKMFGELKRLQALFTQRFTGFATEPFYSAAPLCCAAAAVRVRLLPPADRPARPGATDWSNEFLGQLARGPLVHRLQLQCYVDEVRTPIEDASVDWPESVAPYVDVAELVIEAQDTSTPEARAFAEQVERSVFDPWQALQAHRPLGEVMRARKVVYFESQKARGAS